MDVCVRRATVGAILVGLLAVAPAATQSQTQAEKPTMEILQRQLREQQERLAQLESLLRQQAAVLEKLLREQATTSAGTNSPGDNRVAEESGAQQSPAEQEVERLSGELEVLAENTQAVSERVDQLDKKQSAAEKNLLAKLKGLGNFSFGGDLRLRYEPFFGGELPADRHRFRFRARLNVNARFSDELQAGLQLSSGDALDPTSTNQSFDRFYQRKAIALDRAFLAYNPNWFKPLTLTGGRFGYTWYRTELVFDSDLNVEGFSQALAFDLQNLALKRVILVGFQLPFQESGSGNDSFLYGGQVGSFWKLSDRMKFSGYATYYNWHLTDPVRAAQTAGTLQGNGGTNAGSDTQLASKFGLLDLIGRFDINTGRTRWPLIVQFDYVQNTRACSNQGVAGVPCNPRDRSGWWAEVQVGKTEEPHDLRFGYTFIRIEQEAVLDAFNYSDTRQATNVANHRLNFDYQAYKNLTLSYTLFIGRSLRTALFPDEESYLKRMQLDAVYRF